MERTNYQASNCSIARTLQVVGEKWTLLILRESFYGATRFEQFHQVLQCPRNLLSERLTRRAEQAWHLQDVLVWNKTHTLPWAHPQKLTDTYEHILCFSKSKEFILNLDALRSPVLPPRLAH